MRIQISKKLRFEIFKRDNFTCQYCGNHPPEIILEVDHIVAVINGGENNEDNLVTSCFNCNRGKAANPLTSAPKTLQDRSEEIAEKEAQLLGYYQIINARKERIENEIWEVAKVFKGRDEPLRSDWYRSIKTFIDRLGYHETLDAMEIAVERFNYPTKQCFIYFCGICWKKIKGPSNG